MTFTKQRVTREVAEYVHCPSCGERAGRIDHLQLGIGPGPATAGPWYCDACGRGYEVEVRREGVYAKPIDRSVGPSLVLLRHGSVGLVVRGVRFSDSDGSGTEDFYNESTCPTNYMHSVLAVIDLRTGDADPHGIFKYVAEMPWPDELSTEEGDVLAAAEFDWTPLTIETFRTGAA